MPGKKVSQIIAMCLTGTTTYDHGSSLPTFKLKELDLAKSRIDAQSNMIRLFFQRLGLVEQKHGRQLASTWTSMTIEERKAVLLMSMPDIPADDHPDYAFLRSPDPYCTLSDEQKRRVFLCAHINLHDLVRADCYPVFFHARATNHPSIFARTETARAHIDLTSSALQQPAFDGHRLLVHNEDQYGQVVAASASADNLLMRLEAGFLSLEATSITLKFLISSSAKILGKTLSQFQPQALSQLPSNPIDTAPSGPGSDWPTLHRVSLRTAYRVPANIDLVQLGTVIQSQLTKATEHFSTSNRTPATISNNTNPPLRTLQMKLDVA